MKTLAVLQPSYLPWLGYFDQISRSDVFVYYDDVGYDKNGWRNRNRILGKTGPEWITIPVQVKFKNQPICEIFTDQRQPWKRKHLSQIQHAYARAPYFDYLFPELVKTYQEIETHHQLVDVVFPFISLFNKILNISTPLYRSSLLGIEGDQSGRLLNLCKHFNANRYLSGNAAQSYLDTQIFKDNSIDVEWQNYEHPLYRQGEREFVPFLSVVDLVMWCGPESEKVFRSKQIEKNGSLNTNCSDQPLAGA